MTPGRHRFLIDQLGNTLPQTTYQHSGAANEMTVSIARREVIE
jgi:hypothetical protein